MICLKVSVIGGTFWMLEMSYILIGVVDTYGKVHLTIDFKQANFILSVILL